VGAWEVPFCLVLPVGGRFGCLTLSWDSCVVLQAS
jgi:hypothetical protein